VLGPGRTINIIGILARPSLTTRCAEEDGKSILPAPPDYRHDQQDRAN